MLELHEECLVLPKVEPSSLLLGRSLAGIHPNQLHRLHGYGGTRGFVSDAAVADTQSVNVV